MPGSIKHIVAGGCSQSADGIGGVPPNPSNITGGCSFTNADQIRSPASWVSCLARDLDVDSLCNTAAHSHGNTLMSNSIIDVLTKYPYSNQDTLVLFNLTFISRLDIACDFDHFDRSNNVPWDHTVLPHTYLKQKSQTLQKFYEHIGLPQVKVQSQRAIASLFDFLQRRKFCYRFLLADTAIFDDVDWQTFLASNQENLVQLGSQVGIRNFILHHDLTIDKTHPTLQGHTRIAKIVLDSLA